MSALKQNIGFTRQNSSRVSGGFTIIELILFLALTGLFLLIALNGITGRADNARFSDSMRSLEGFSRQLTNDIFTGVNAVGSGNVEDVIILGFMLRFQDDSNLVEVSRIRGARLDTWDPEPGNAVIDSIQALPPDTSIVYDTSTYDVKWGTKFIYAQNKSQFDTDLETHVWGVLREPNGSALMPGMFLDRDMTNADLNDPASYNSLQTRIISVHACFLGVNDQIGEFVFSGGAADFNFEAFPDRPSEACNRTQLINAGKL